jgi:hypothetical protein
MLGMGYDGPDVSHISQNTRNLRDCNTRHEEITQGEGEIVADLNAGTIIDRMQQVADVRTDIALGAYFGHGTSTVSGWRTRNKVPYEECVILAKRKGVSLDWLLLGLGTMQSAGEPGAVTDGAAGDDERVRRMVGFLRHWSTTSSSDSTVWLEMQFARTVPEYAEWVASRKK